MLLAVETGDYRAEVNNLSETFYSCVKYTNFFKLPLV